MMACPHIHACSVQNRCDIVGMNALHGKVYDAVVLLRVLASENIYLGYLFQLLQVLGGQGQFPLLQGGKAKRVDILDSCL